MTYDPERHHRRSIRLTGYDYSQPGAYFVTIVAQDRACLFGEVTDGEMRLNDMGRVVERCWRDIPVHFPHVALDAFVIMPNHVHGIVVIVGAGSPRPYIAPVAETASVAGTASGAGTAPLRRATLGQMVAHFKYQSTKRINEYRGVPGQPVWQRNYYEHIIRNEESLGRICEYIANNPLQWVLDRENPDMVGAIDKSPLQNDEPWRI